MALPIWGMYMKDLYADEALDISKDAFPRPDNLSIEINCDEYNQESDSENNSVPDELDF